jgi:glycosyltransferase involved in cell wall biosynthesis
MEHIIIYPNYLPKVGGIETAVYQLSKLLTKRGYKVTIAFLGAESNAALFHYAEVADVIRLETNTKIEGDVCLIASNHLRPRQIEAKKWIQWIHSDYEKYNNLQLVRNPEVTQYVAVSEHCAKIAQKMFNIKPKVIYNLLDEEFGSNKEKPLRLVTNSRISPEKGFSRMLQFAKQLKAEGVRFEWRIYGDNSHRPQEYEDVKRQFKDIEEVLFVGYKSDVTMGLLQADYLVQLSDFEGCPYAVLEALQMEVPCIVTDYLGVREIIKDGINGHVIPLDMKNIDIKKIVKKIPKFKYEPLSSIEDWEKLL